MKQLAAFLNEQRSALSARDYALVEKATRIITDNICEGEEFPWHPYRMIRPFGGCPKDAGSTGIWNWDSAFHAIGALYFDETLAKEQILGFTQYQLENGMLIDMKRKNGDKNDASSKPPIMAYTASLVYQKTGDTEFLKSVYPRFVKNTAFWEANRFFGGLFHYGADLTKIPFAQVDEYIRWESGWDNSVRWDSPCSDYWPIDLNCYAVLMYRGMAEMAEALGRASDAAAYREKARVTADLIEEKLWNEERATYADTNRFTGEVSPIMTPASFMPLYIGIASPERAAKMHRFACDEKKLFPGMPTVSYDDPAYSVGYWRGNTWLNVAYFAARGLLDYGFSETAYAIRDTILSWVARDGDCIHENYNSKTGEGLFCTHFSWSSVFVLEFILNFA